MTSWWVAGRKTGGETGETLVAVVGVRAGPGPEQPRLPASVGGEIPRGKHPEPLTPLTLSETDTQPAATQLRLETRRKKTVGNLAFQWVSAAASLQLWRLSVEAAVR